MLHSDLAESILLLAVTCDLAEFNDYFYFITIPQCAQKQKNTINP